MIKNAVIKTSIIAHKNLSPKNHAITLIQQATIPPIKYGSFFIEPMINTKRKAMTTSDKAKSTHKTGDLNCHVLDIGSYIRISPLKSN